jgi:hypothetical protein
MTNIVVARFVAILAIIEVACSQHPSVAPTPASTSIANFVATSPNNSTTPPRDQCWLAGVFDGAALVRGRELEVVIPRAWVAITRDNDKQWDDLHLVIEVSGHPLGDQRWVPVARSLPIVLAPTVDSAGPQLTTWQSSDTLRLLVPWNAAFAPRWLLFDLDYHTVSHKGRTSNCAGTLGTDTLRFRRIEAR